MRLSRGNRGGLAFNELGIETAVVRCYHCGRAASISARALTARCEHCGKNLDIQDLRIKGNHWGGILVTCGRIAIGRKAEVTCTMAVASLGIDIMGRFTGLLVSGGPVTVASRASVRGAVWAPSITLEPGASLVGGPCVVPCDPLGYVELNGNRTQVPSSPPPVRAA